MRGKAEAARGHSPGGQAGSAMEAVSDPQGCGAAQGGSAGPEARSRALSRLRSQEDIPHLLPSVCVQGWEFSRTRAFVNRYFASPQLLGFSSWKCCEKCNLWSPLLSVASACTTDAAPVYLYLALKSGG